MQQGGGNFRLVVRRGPQIGQIFDLNRPSLVLGREAENDIAINDPEVSRRHCRFTLIGNSYAVEDLGSTNGTLVNGQRVTGQRTLASGDTIQLGETITIVFEIIGGVPRGPAYASPHQQVTNIGADAPRGGYGQAPAAPPYAGGYQQPPPPAYGAPPAYAPPAQQAPQGGYDYPDEYASGGSGRWIFLACGVFMVLCIVTSVVSIILIDQTCAWDNIPILSDVVDALGYQVDPTVCD